MPPPPHSNGANGSSHSSSSNPEKKTRQTRESRSREQELREHAIHTRIVQRMRERKTNPLLALWNAKTLAEEMEYSRRCIQNDIKQMRLKGYPIDFDTKLNGLYYTRSFAPVLTPAITESELARLFVGFRAVAALKDSPCFEAIVADIEKLNEALANRFNLDYASFTQCITFRSTGLDATVDPAVFDTLVTAIRERQELEIIYSKLNHSVEGECPHEPVPPSSADPSSAVPSSALGPPTTDARHPTPGTAPHPATLPHPAAPWLQVPVETRIVHPLHLLSHDSALYLFLWDTKRKDLRRFALGRMRSVKPTGKTFKPRKFDVEEQIHNLSGVTSGKTVQVRVLFRGKASFLVAERPYNSSQKLAPGPNAEWNLEVTLQATHNPELERWLMGYDQDFDVLEPASLREAIAREVDGMIAVRRGKT